MSFDQLPIAERFMRYVQIDTQSDPDSTKFPSTDKQLNLAKLLVEELKGMGIMHVELDAYGYVMATIPSNKEEQKPVLCFCAHMDTAPDCSGTDVKPILHKNYNGQPLVLPDDHSQVISIEAYPYLKNFIGKDIITASGNTLLGADDKAGVAIIMSFAQYLMQHPEILHGTIKILFTPDEEVGRGTDFLDLKKLGADFAYTLDGGELGCFEMETFSADYLTMDIQGVIAHPGAAKGVMQNAIKIAGEIIAALPKQEWSPEHTEQRQGFVHPNHISGGAEKARLEFLIRDHDTQQLKEHIRKLKSIADHVLLQNPDFSKSHITYTIKEQYRNMREVIDLHPILVENALAAYKKVGVLPIVEPIRGGTDGSRLSFLGLPAPNIFTGMQAIHSKHEWIGVSDMQKSVEVLVNLVEIF
ncbi:MAG: peptidase [Bacteroidota bacterium]